MKNLKTSLIELLDKYLEEKKEILKIISLYGEEMCLKGNKIELDIVNEKIVEVTKIINKL
jgi:hypothetical protein|tara:strand:- start:97 stop:276 length:180 start_codon:yes stop_codon:yes gene_type:complete